MSPARLLSRLLPLAFLLVTALPSLTRAADDYRSTIERQETVVLDFLRAFERVQEHLHPDRFPAMQAELAETFGTRLDRLRIEANALAPPPGFRDFDRTWREAVGLLDTAYGVFTRTDAARFIPAVFRSRTAFTRACYLLYEMRRETPTLQLFWGKPDEAPFPDTPRPASESAPEVGIVHRPASGTHAGYALYVPEQYATDGRDPAPTIPGRRWPLIVALHGAGGSGADYLLTWLRPAKRRGYVVLAPNAHGPTWAIERPERDVVSIGAMIAEVRERYAIDPDRIFVTGLSDGGTFTYALGVHRAQTFAALAPVAAVLPPWLDVQQARQLPVLIVHGGRDFIFPVAAARQAGAALREAGFVGVTYRELPDWGHAFPYAINADVVLPWFEALFQ